MIRNRVKRRLRAIVAPRIGGLPNGTALVVRALPAAAGASFAELSDDVDGALRHAVAKATR